MSNNEEPCWLFIVKFLQQPNEFLHYSYGLAKGLNIFFFVFSVISYQGKNPVYNLGPDGIDHSHFIFPLGYFAFKIIPEFAFHFNG